ncbi:MAG: hypothetical protein FWG50_12305 [Kiritimatiellaeota bacterium]|nr:hypothetical protein [Kiritimatiellota bacterium]
MTEYFHGAALFSCVWSDDLSGTLQGVGGLLAAFICESPPHHTSCHTLCDANGNVTAYTGYAYLDTEYAYGAFGNTIEQLLNKGARRCTPAVKVKTGRLPDGTSGKCAKNEQIRSCVKSYAKTNADSNDYAPYNAIGNNCGHWVINVLKKCCLEGKIPDHYYGPNLGGWWNES